MNNRLFTPRRVRLVFYTGFVLLIASLIPFGCGDSTPYGTVPNRGEWRETPEDHYSAISPEMKDLFENLPDNNSKPLIQLYKNRAEFIAWVEKLYQLSRTGELSFEGFDEMSWSFYGGSAHLNVVDLWQQHTLWSSDAYFVGVRLEGRRRTAAALFNHVRVPEPVCGDLSPSIAAMFQPASKPGWLKPRAAIAFNQRYASEDKNKWLESSELSTLAHELVHASGAAILTTSWDLRECRVIYEWPPTLTGALVTQEMARQATIVSLSPLLVLQTGTLPDLISALASIPAAADLMTPRLTAADSRYTPLLRAAWDSACRRRFFTPTNGYDTLNIYPVLADIWDETVQASKGK